MTRAFIAMLDVGSDTDFVGFAADISDVLISQGFNVIYVNPWNADAQVPVAPPPAPVVIAPPPPLPPSPPIIF